MVHAAWICAPSVTDRIWSSELMARVGIIAAMFREVHPLVRNMAPLKYLPDRRVQMYQSKNAVIAYAGMGCEPAMVAARAVLSTGEIHSLVSVGWAGGLNPTAVA